VFVLFDGEAIGLVECDPNYFGALTMTFFLKHADRAHQGAIAYRACRNNLI
jgi:hypothetical protein